MHFLYINKYLYSLDISAAVVPLIRYSQLTKLWSTFLASLNNIFEVMYSIMLYEHVQTDCVYIREGEGEL